MKTIKYSPILVIIHIFQYFENNEISALQLLINTKDINENQNGFDQGNPLGSAYIKVIMICLV